MRQLAALPYVAAGGAVGALCRWGLLQLAGADRAEVMTLVINIVGSLLLGLCVGLRLTRDGEQRLTHNQFLLLGAGFCGGFTTFAGFAVQVALLLDNGEPLAGLVFAIATPVVAVLIAGIGYRFGSRP